MHFAWTCTCGTRVVRAGRWAALLTTTALGLISLAGAAWGQAPSESGAPTNTAATAAETPESGDTVGTPPPTPTERSDATDVDAEAAAPPTPEAPRSTSAALTAWAAEQSPPCKVRAIAKSGDAHLLACGEAGLWRVRTAEGGFLLEAREQRGGEVVGFTLIDGVPLVLVDLRVIQPLDGGTKVVTGTVAVVDQPEPTVAAWGDDRNVALGGTVESIEGIRIGIQLPRGHRVVVGYRVAFTWGGQRVVGRVVRADPMHADVLIGLNEPSPPIGTAAEGTPEGTTSRIMAPRDGDYHYRLDLGVRGGFSRDGIFGAEGGIMARYGHLALSAEVRPFAFSTMGIEVVQAFVSVGVTTTWFGISFGGGTTTVNRHGQNPPGTGILMTPAVRFGTIDGFNVRARLGVALHRQEMTFTALFVDSQIPISRSFALLAGGGGGDLGLAEWEAGLRSLLLGKGGKGSWFLHTTAGATVLGHNTATAAAPHVRIVVETRL